MGIDLSNIMSSINNYSGFIGCIIALIALIIAIQSYRISTLKADLTLYYQVYLSEEYMKGIWFENDKGKLKLECQEVKKGAKTTEYRTVEPCRPNAEVEFIIENKGKVAAKNPVLNFFFVGMDYPYEIIRENDYWKGTIHNHGIGTWSEIRWQPIDNTVIHPGLPVRFREFCFSGADISVNGAYIDVLLSADNFVAKSFKIPVEVM
jgi:hypothetical protein